METNTEFTKLPSEDGSKRRLYTVLSFLAQPAEQQIQLVPEIPYDRGVRDYYTTLNHNPLLLIVDGVVEDYSQPESESDADYLSYISAHTA